MVQKLSEEQLIQLYLEKKDPAIFEELVRRHISKLRNLIYRIVYDVETADDIVQDTFLKVYEKIDSFKGRSTFSTWLCQIGINMALNYKKKNTRYQMIDIAILDEQSTAPSPEEFHLEQEELKEINQHIQALPDKLRVALLLSTIENKDINEIARILGCQKATVYWRIHQARKILNEKIGNN